MRVLLGELLLRDVGCRRPTGARVTDTRCGEVNVPGGEPVRARELASPTRAVVVLPFVPVTWIDGYVSCGSVSSVGERWMRSRVGPGMRLGLASVRGSATASRTVHPDQPSRARRAAPRSRPARCASVASRSRSFATTSAGGLRQEPRRSRASRSRAPRRSRPRRALRQAGALGRRRRSTPGRQDRTKPSASAAWRSPSACPRRLDDGERRDARPGAGSRSDS